MIAEKAVVFCATQRTGSTLVYDDFRNIAGAIGRAPELLHKEIAVNKTQRAWGDLWNEVTKFKNVQGTYLEKVMFHYTPMISRYIETGSTAGVERCTTFEPRLFDGFYNFFANATWVYVERRDVFSQAVSMYLAEKKDVWFARWNDKPAELRDRPDPRYDFKLLKPYLSGFLTEREQWQSFFTHYKIDPVRIYYEDAVDNYPEYLDELFERSGLQKIRSNPPRRFLKQGTELNEKWARWLRDDILLELYGRSLPES